jgi:hypothetical protein
MQAPREKSPRAKLTGQYSQVVPCEVARAIMIRFRKKIMYITLQSPDEMSQVALNYNKRFGIN